ncbi:MAG: hypothetical protein ACQGVC_25865 [Myxococcota bacterium]
MDTDAPEGPPEPREDLPASLIPRWFALLVLIALVASGGWCSYAVLTMESGDVRGAEVSEEAR